MDRIFYGTSHRTRISSKKFWSEIEFQHFYKGNGFLDIHKLVWKLIGNH